MLDTAPALRRTLRIFTNRYEFDPLAVSIVYNVPRDWRASLALFLVTHASPFPSSDFLRSPAPRSLRSAPKSHGLRRTHNDAFVSFQTPGHISPSLLGTTPFLSSLFSFSLGCPTPKCLPSPTNNFTMTRLMSPGASASASSRGGTSSGCPLSPRFLRTETRMASRRER